LLDNFLGGGHGNQFLRNVGFLAVFFTGSTFFFFFFFFFCLGLFQTKLKFMDVAILSLDLVFLF